MTHPAIEVDTSATSEDRHEHRYRRTLRELQSELVKFQRQLIAHGERIVVLIEGRDAAGKDGVIKHVIEHLSPRETRVVALRAPSERDQTRWYFQRYVEHLPAAAEFVLFNVLYEDGSVTSNRKVPGSTLGGLDGDAPARDFIEAHDREIFHACGRRREIERGWHDLFPPHGAGDVRAAACQLEDRGAAEAEPDGGDFGGIHLRLLAQ
jgi:hypothetical protein